MRKRRFVYGDRHAHVGRRRDVDVHGHDEQGDWKRVRRLVDADGVEPDDMLVRILDFGTVVIVMRGFGNGVMRRLGNWMFVG